MHILARAYYLGRITVLMLPFILSFGSVLSAQHKITVTIYLDTTKWAPVAYLSLIPDFSQMNTISYDHIIEQAGTNKDGFYEFSTEYFPEKEQLYRIHFSKKGDPPASLIIGGKDHNHFFLFAARKNEISIIVNQGEKLLNELKFEGYYPNKALQEFNIIFKVLDSLDHIGKNVNREYAMSAVYSDIKEYVDTCSLPLVSLYALYNIDYLEDYQSNPGFYRHYLRKWRSQKSLYFRKFRSSIRQEVEPLWVIGAGGGSITLLIFIIMIIYFRRKKKKRKSPLTDLSIQERKVFELLKQGKSNKEIAEECAVSVSTIKSHVNSIFSKLGISSRKEIIEI